MKPLLMYFLRSLIDWIFWRRSVGLTLVRLGVLLFGLLLFGLTVGVTVPTTEGPFIFSWDSSSSASESLSWGIFIIAIILVMLGIILIIRDIRREDSKKVIVVEARGLRDWKGDPLASAVPPSMKGRREQVLVDVRQGLVDGQIVSPDAALRRIANLPDDIARRVEGLNRAAISFVLGGLAPVPLLFLLGVIIDDESRTWFMDWDRSQHAWRNLDEDDDGKSFAISGLDALPTGASRVALAISASYDVLDADIRVVEAGIPIVRMDLEERSVASHWSEAKQRRLAQQFLDTVMALGRQGVSEIALFLACPASIALRFGTVYDKRNLPSVEVNQYEQVDPRKFPWAVHMPVAGRTRPELKLR